MPVYDKTKTRLENLVDVLIRCIDEGRKSGYTTPAGVVVVTSVHPNPDKVRNLYFFLPSGSVYELRANGDYDPLEETISPTRGAAKLQKAFERNL